MAVRTVEMRVTSLRRRSGDAVRTAVTAASVMPATNSDMRAMFGCPRGGRLPVFVKYRGWRTTATDR